MKGEKGGWGVGVKFGATAPKLYSYCIQIDKRLGVYKSKRSK